SRICECALTSAIRASASRISRYTSWSSGTGSGDASVVIGGIAPWGTVFACRIGTDTIRTAAKFLTEQAARTGGRRNDDPLRVHDQDALRPARRQHPHHGRHAG